MLFVHKPLLDIAEMLNEGEIPSIYYLSKCRSVFTVKKLLETVSKQQGTDEQQPTAAKRTSIRRQSPCVCLFCVSLLREQEIGNPWYNKEICLRITQLENQPWKRRSVGFSQLRHVKSYQLKLVTKRATRAILGLRQATMGASDGCGESLEDESEDNRQTASDRMSLEKRK